MSEVYKRPYDPQHPVVCADETRKQLMGEVRTPVPAAPRQVAHYDSEYVRNGVAILFMVFEPLAGQRDAEVTDRCTKENHAERLRYLPEEVYLQAEAIVLVQDNLNTHSLASITCNCGRPVSRRIRVLSATDAPKGQEACSECRSDFAVDSWKSLTLGREDTRRSTAVFIHVAMRPWDQSQRRDAPEDSWPAARCRAKPGRHPQRKLDRRAPFRSKPLAESDRSAMIPAAPIPTLSNKA